MKVAVVIPAAGQGKRFTASQTPGEWSVSKNKIEVDLAGRSVLMRTVELFVARPRVEQVIVAVNPDHIAEFKFRWGDKLGFHGVHIVPGGRAERWQTVHLALDAVEDERCTHVAVHDAVRPLASDKLIERIFEAAMHYPAVIPAVPVHGTLKRISHDEPEEDRCEADPIDAILGSAGKSRTAVRRVVQTVSRADLVEVQTPQVFELGLIRRAYAQVASGELAPAQITDDAGLIEAIGQSVYVVDGEPSNLKITRHGDLELATAVITAREQKKAVAIGKKHLFSSDDGDEH